MVTANNYTITFYADDNSITYGGPKVLNEFQVLDVFSHTNQTEFSTKFTFGISLARLAETHLATTFFQTFLLWFLAYLTLFIDLTDFSNRFMGSLTALLVLASLLSSSKSGLPKTAYFKYIDVWFNWYILNIFIIIVVHTVVDSLERNKGNIQRHIGLRKVLDSSGMMEEVKNSKAVTANNIAKITIPLVTLAFIIIYFTVNLI